MDLAYEPAWGINDDISFYAISPPPLPWDIQSSPPRRNSYGSAPLSSVPSSLGYPSSPPTPIDASHRYGPIEIFDAHVQLPHRSLNPAALDNRFENLSSHGILEQDPTCSAHNLISTTINYPGLAYRCESPHPVQEIHPALAMAQQLSTAAPSMAASVFYQPLVAVPMSFIEGDCSSAMQSALENSHLHNIEMSPPWNEDDSPISQLSNHYQLFSSWDADDHSRAHDLAPWPSSPSVDEAHVEHTPFQREEEEFGMLTLDDKSAIAHLNKEKGRARSITKRRLKATKRGKSPRNSAIKWKGIKDGVHYDRIVPKKQWLCKICPDRYFERREHLNRHTNYMHPESLSEDDGLPGVECVFRTFGRPDFCKVGKEGPNGKPKLMRGDNAIQHYRTHLKRDARNKTTIPELMEFSIRRHHPDMAEKMLLQIFAGWKKDLQDGKEWGVPNIEFMESHDDWAEWQDSLTNEPTFQYLDWDSLRFGGLGRCVAKL